LPRLKNKFLTVLFGTAVFLQASALQSAELLDVKVEKDEERYTLYSETVFAVGPQALYELLIDYEKFDKFTSAIVEAKNVEADEEGRPGFYARMEGCALLFCKSFIRHGYLILTPISEIVAMADPEKSDFKYSRERWQIIANGKGTLLIYDFEMEPAFWIPPVIGPFFIQRALKNGAIRAVNRIERLALEIENETKAANSVH
jgi:ribosome-associated toxin RatA of RatAB toxin-antitoxin module